MQPIRFLTDPTRPSAVRDSRFVAGREEEGDRGERRVGKVKEWRISGCY